VRDYRKYQPIPVDTLPAQFAGIFHLLELTFTPANDMTIVTTITGQNLQLVCQGGTETDNRKKAPVVAAGYQKAIWELREGHLRYCPSQDRLWRRDPDMSDHDGGRLLLNSWHPVKTIEDEYHIGATANSRERNPLYSAAILRESKRAQWFDQVERGVRCDPCVWVRRDGKVVCLQDVPDIAVTQTFTPVGMGVKALKEAERILRWLTVDEKSYANLCRMFATPWLEPFKQLSYVLSGHGGDGKTLIARQALVGVLGVGKVFPGFSVQQYCNGGVYTLGRESMNDEMDGKAFAFDDEACAVDEDMLPLLRALSTGSQMNARVTGGKYRVITPSATMLYLTNMQFADSTENSDMRRFVKVEFHPSKGRSYDEYHAIEGFCHRHPAAFFVLSCRLWEKSDVPEIVNLSPARNISDEMYWLISEIVSNEEQYGALVASRNDYRKEFHSAVPQSLMDVLGLENSKTKVLPGGQCRVVRVVDRERFDVYRKAALGTEAEETATDWRQTALSKPNRDSLIPLDDVGGCHDMAALVESALDGQAGFAPCEGKARRQGGPVDGKVSLSWKRLNPSSESHVDSTIVTESMDRYAVVPLGDCFVIDCDKPTEDGEPDGWQCLQALTGDYGTDNLPATLVTKTPHGVHLYYRMPAGMDIGLLKNAVHEQNLPIDLRVSNKGYVLGPGSVIDGKRYELVDLPAGVVPEASEAIMRMLKDYGYTNEPKPDAPQMSLDDVMADRRATSISNGMPDMTPVPEGQRNSTLHAWAYGRFKNHPENEHQIHDDLLQRGRDSGLADAELDQIWKSIKRSLN
jgi:hypothetical protein